MATGLQRVVPGLVHKALTYPTSHGKGGRKNELQYSTPCLRSLIKILVKIDFYLYETLKTILTELP